MSLVNEGRFEIPAAIPTYSYHLMRIVEGARSALQQSHYLPLRSLRCDYHEGVLSIRGQVPTFYLKQLAQSLVAKVSGVEQVANRVEVVPPGRSLPPQDT